MRLVVIGGGIVGGSIAWRLAQAGVDVTWVDARRIGGEASWAGAGMLAPGGELIARSSWAQFALESFSSYPAFVEELTRESGVGIDFRRCGAMESVRSKDEWQEVHARVALQRDLGIRSETRDDGVFYPDDALVDPREIMRALAYCCEKLGVNVREQTRVVELALAQRGVEIQTQAGVIAAEAAVLAAGAWSSEIRVRGFEIPPVFPVRGHLLGYAMDAGSLGPILRHGHTYVMQRSSGFTIAGTSSEQVGFKREIDPHIVSEIHAQACELWPPLASARRTDAWLGFRPATANFEPVIGRLQDTPVWLAYGHYRNGILLAPATAARVAGEITSSLGKG